MSKVLVGVDGSDASRRTVDFAVELAKDFEIGIIVVHVIPWSPYSFTTSEENEHRHLQREVELVAAREQIVEPAIHQVANANIKVEAVVRHGHPVEVMIEIARERGVRHIIVGRTGDSRIKQALFGSLPTQLILHSTVPVTVVP